MFKQLFDHVFYLYLLNMATNYFGHANIRVLVTPGHTGVALKYLPEMLNSSMAVAALVFMVAMQSPCMTVLLI